MHSHTVETLSHEHVFLGPAHDRHARRARWVVGLTTIMMAGEIVAGIAFGSMALLADGLHMATHAGALGIAAFAYAYARRHARNARFTFGTGKVGDLAAFGSALLLGLTAILIGWEAVQRLFAPVPIAFDEAIPVAVLGLGVNLVSALLLAADHDDDHGHAHAEHRHHDHNLRAAYMHVLADALTSILAIAALVLGRLYGLIWVDPLTGLVGALVIARWSWSLLRDSGAVLLDAAADPHLADEIRRTFEGESADRISDLHLWRVGPGQYAAIVSVVSDSPAEPEAYKARLAHRRELVHVTVEAHRCPGSH